MAQKAKMSRPFRRGVVCLKRAWRVIVGSYKTGRGTGRTDALKEAALVEMKKKKPDWEKILRVRKAVEEDIKRNEEFIRQVRKLMKTAQKIGKPADSYEGFIKKSQAAILSHKRFLRKIGWRHR